MERPGGGDGAYAPGKAGLAAMADAIRLEMRAVGVTVVMPFLGV